MPLSLSAVQIPLLSSKPALALARPFRSAMHCGPAPISLPSAASNWHQSAFSFSPTMTHRTRLVRSCRFVAWYNDHTKPQPAFDIPNRSICQFKHISFPQRQALTKARDIRDIGIGIDLLHMTKPGQRFDFAAFYSSIVTIDVWHALL